MMLISLWEENTTRKRWSFHIFVTTCIIIRTTEYLHRHETYTNKWQLALKISYNGEQSVCIFNLSSVTWSNKNICSERESKLFRFFLFQAISFHFYVDILLSWRRDRLSRSVIISYCSCRLSFVCVSAHVNVHM